MDNERQLGENFAYITDEAELLTRAQLAEAMKVSQQSVGQLIRGDTKTLMVWSAIRAARTLGVTVEDLATTDLRRHPKFLSGNGKSRSTKTLQEASGHYNVSQFPRLAALFMRCEQALKLGQLRDEGIEYLHQTLELLVATAKATKPRGD